MSTYISNRELEELGEGLTRHYLENAHIHMAARCIDIEGLANYLGMTVVFETFAEEDRDQDRKQLLQVISQLSDIARNM